MRILLAVAAVVAMVAACQVEPEPNVTSIPAATSHYIDSAVAGCRDAAYNRYYDSPFRLGWVQAECDKAGEEARKGDWDRGLLPTPSTLSPEPTYFVTPVDIDGCYSGNRYFHLSPENGKYKAEDYRFEEERKEGIYYGVFYRSDYANNRREPRSDAGFWQLWTWIDTADTEAEAIEKFEVWCGEYRRERGLEEWQ